jgi:phosphoglycolate phosphatase-like HAD superfamily hydrolase
MSTYPNVTVVFDLDGTLIDSAEFDGALYVEAVREVIAGVDIDESWRKYRHVTDEGVLAQVLEEFRPARAEELRARVRDEFGSKVARYLAAGGRCECVPGAKAAIDELQAAGYRVGIATGGWGHTAAMKLAHAGISLQGLVLTSSDHSYDRVEIMSECLRRLGGTPDHAVYVGDGRWDLEASRRAAWRFIGVGEKLRGLCAQWIADFTDPQWRTLHSG